MLAGTNSRTVGSKVRVASPDLKPSASLSETVTETMPSSGSPAVRATVAFESAANAIAESAAIMATAITTASTFFAIFIFEDLPLSFFILRALQLLIPCKEYSGIIQDVGE